MATKSKSKASDSSPSGSDAQTPPEEEQSPPEGGDDTQPSDDEANKSAVEAEAEADAELKAGNSDDDAPLDPETPTQQQHEEALKLPMSERGSGEGSEPVDDYSELDPTDPQYSPYQDPAVESSVIADVIVLELEGDGKSPTLDECRRAYKERKDAEAENA